MPDVLRSSENLEKLLAQIQATPAQSIGGTYEALLTNAKKDGVYYTPDWIARYLTERTLGQTLETQFNALQKALSQKNTEQAAYILGQVQALHVVDPSCGCGIFLTAALKELHAFYRKAQALAPDLFPCPPARYAFTYQLYGVDLDPVAVRLTQHQLHLLTIELDQAPFPLHSKASNLCAGDALTPLQMHIDAAPRLQAKAEQMSGAMTKETGQETCMKEPFSWETAFPEVDQWDFVLGNPPYLTEVRKHADRFRKLKTDSRIQQHYRAKMDLCDAFLALSTELLKPQGSLALVLPEYWLQRSSTQDLRRTIWQNGHIQELWISQEYKVFKQAPGLHSSLLVWQKASQATNGNKSRHSRFGYLSGPELSAQQLTPVLIQWDAPSGKLLYGPENQMALLEKLVKQPRRLPDTVIQQGIVFPQSRLKANDSTKLTERPKPGTGIFVLSQAEREAIAWTPDEVALFRPYYGTAGFQASAGFTTDPDWVIYTDRHAVQALQAHPENYPNIRHHLERFAPINTSAHAPYGLHRARQSHWFEGSPRVYCLRQAQQPTFAVVREAAYVNEGFYILKPAGWNIDVLTTILNSYLAWFWLYHQKRKGHRLQVDKDILLHFPLPEVIPTKIEQDLLQSALSASPTNQQAIYRLYQLNSAEIKLIEDFVAQRNV